jgi:hypothetical protein
MVRVPVDIVIVRQTTQPQFGPYPWKAADVRDRMAELVDYWERHDVIIQYASIKTVVNDDWGVMEADKYGNGELHDVVSELYVDKPVLLFVPTIDVDDDASVAGITAGGERRGWAIPSWASSKTAAHETGHMFGLFHYPIDSHNLMHEYGGKGMYPPLTKGQVGKVKLTIRKKGWGY